jgi:hypothetical protein
MELGNQIRDDDFDGSHDDWKSPEARRRVLADAFSAGVALTAKPHAAAGERSRLRQPDAALQPAHPNGSLPALVDAEIEGRARRTDVLPGSLFADPAWDILLELYRGELRHYRIPVSSLCAASQVPPTTALRYMKQLECEGLLARDPDRLDGRRWYVRLTAAGSTAMTLYFSNGPEKVGVRVPSVDKTTMLDHRA